MAYSFRTCLLGTFYSDNTIALACTFVTVQRFPVVPCNYIQTWRSGYLCAIEPVVNKKSVKNSRGGVDECV